MRKKIVAANWKMNMTQGESARFVESFLRDVGEITDVEVVIVPPFTAIAKVTEALGRAQNIKVGAQNMYWEKSGAFTGEISAALLRDLFVHYVVLGHSERRTLFGETDEIVNRKVRAAHEATLRPIVCVGETLEQRDKGNVEKILSIQLRGSLAGLTSKGIAGNGDCLRTGLGDRHRAQRDARAGAGSARVHPPHSARNVRRRHRRASPDPVRRQRETGECPRTHEPAGHRRRPRRRRQPRSAQLRPNRQGRARRVAQASSLWGNRASCLVNPFGSVIFRPASREREGGPSSAFLFSPILSNASFINRRLLAAAGGIHTGEGQEVDHAKTFRCSVMCGQCWYPTWLDG